MEFNEASADFLAAVRDIGPHLGDYPPPQTIDLEVAFNHWGALPLGLDAFPGGLPLRPGGQRHRLETFARRLGADFYRRNRRHVRRFRPARRHLRRAPITNMYESVLSVGVGIAILGLIVEIVYRKGYLLIAAAAVSALTLILAENFDSRILPLQPILRDDFWLWTHVVTIMASYATLAVAWILANILLGCHSVISLSKHPAAPEGKASDRQEYAGEELQDILNNLTLIILRIGVLLLAAGTILGGVWGDFAWGRFWGWDSKETWALITLLFYLAVLHVALRRLDRRLRLGPLVGHFLPGGHHDSGTASISCSASGCTATAAGAGKYRTLRTSSSPSASKFCIWPRLISFIP